MPTERAQSLEVVSDAGNFAVVRMPGRRFPGCVIQGDTLGGLYSDLRDLERGLRATLGKDHDLLAEISGIVGQLRERLWWYEQDLKRAGYSEIPYAETVGMPNNEQPVV